MASIARIAFFLGKNLNTRIALSWDSMGQRWFFLDKLQNLML